MADPQAAGPEGLAVTRAATRRGPTASCASFRARAGRRACAHSLLTGGDRYFLLADYAAYVAAQDRVARTYRDQAEWTRRSIVNVGHMGKFSSDRTIRQYAAEVWHASPMKVE